MNNVTRLGPGDPETWGAAGAKLRRDEKFEQLMIDAEDMCERIVSEYYDEWPSRGDPLYDEHKQALVTVLEAADDDDICRWFRGKEVAQDLRDLVSEEFSAILFARLIEKARDICD